MDGIGVFVALVEKVAKADGKVDGLEAMKIEILFDNISEIFPEPKNARQNPFHKKCIFNISKVIS